ncbi:MAG: two-component sensor histidine kinase [Rhodospirillaceae bacterium]|nr:two-component sensor histidine kinase [Rhodospirillaceae bacterium]
MSRAPIDEKRSHRDRTAAWAFAKAAVTTSSPAAVALIFVVIDGDVSFIGAIAAWLIGLAVAAVIVRPNFLGFRAVRHYVDSLRQAEDDDSRQLLELPAEARRRFGDFLRLDLYWRRRVHRATATAVADSGVIDTLPVPLLLLGRNGIVLRTNRAARAILDRDAESRDIAAVLRNPSLLSAVDDVYAGAPAQQVEFSWPAGERDLTAHVWTTPEAVSPDIRVAIVIQDLTAMKRMEQMRADFVANASHELRTPLTSLAGFIDTLRSVPPEDSETRERFLRIMEEQTERMKRVVTDLLSLSEIELNEHDTPDDLVDLADLLGRVRAAMGPASRAREVTLDLFVPDDLPLVPGDGDQLFQVFQNLVDNAIKYGDSDSTVTIDVRPSSREDGMVLIAVRDEGYGIPREHLDRLTERFYRVDTARSRRLGGTGLGLAIVKHVLNRHRGRLAIESALGKGSTFTVFLPIAAKPEGTATESS